jgi:ribosomal protein S7
LYKKSFFLIINLLCAKKEILEEILAKIKSIIVALKRAADSVGMTDVHLFFEKTLANIAISHELRSRRVGGATYQVPKVLEDYRSLSKTLKLIVKVIRGIQGKSLDVAIAIVLTDAYNKTGSIFSAYTNLSTAVESNRVNSVYRW